MKQDEIKRLREDIALVRASGHTKIPIPIATLEAMLDALDPTKPRRQVKS